MSDIKTYYAITIIKAIVRLTNGKDQEPQEQSCIISTVIQYMLKITFQIGEERFFKSLNSQAVKTGT